MKRTITEADYLNEVLAEFDRQRQPPPKGAICARDLSKQRGIKHGAAVAWLNAQNFESGLFHVGDRTQRYYWPRKT